MIKRILKSTSYILLSIFIATTTIFTSVYPVYSAQIRSGNNIDQSLDIEIEDSSETIDSLKNSNKIDLGDDQTFPFIPGFGKN
tara:strand:- start:1404 stop:1652 length:249 start_codon:yes stop_codon:yes gene_type:complete